MAFEYQKDVTDSQNPIVSVDPYWILLVVPYQDRVTFSSPTVVTSGDISRSDIKNDPVATNDMVLLDNHCIKWSVQSNKNNHVHSASFTLVPPHVIRTDGESGIQTVQGNQQIFAKEFNVAPPDWVMFWVLEDKQGYDRVLQQVLSGADANGVDSGLKFVGRVSSFRSQLNISGNGVKVSRYSMDCHGFREFENTVYYNEMVFSTQVENPSKIINDIAGGINEFIVSIGTEQKTLVQTQVAIPALFHMLFDVNFAQAVSGRATLTPEQQELFQQLSATPNAQYFVPQRVAYLLGAEYVYTKGAPTYSDLLYQYVGVEQYNRTGKRNDSTTAKNYDFSKYWSDNLTESSRFRLCYEYPSAQQLNDNLIKQVLHFDERSAWSVLTTYLNDPVNEIYTTLKVTPDKNGTQKIMPSLVCRQLPFSSKSFADQSIKPVTQFLELPRWKIGEARILSYNVGLSDALDINYVRLEPLIPSEDQTAQRAALNSFAPPILDSADISRNGLRMYHRQVGAADVPSADGGEPTRFWQSMMSDILMKQKYTVNGSVVCKGIQDPVCVGDNLVIRDILFHIEGVVHEGGIDVSGKKYFNTTFQLSHGVKISNSEGDYIPQQLKSPEV